MRNSVFKIFILALVLGLWFQGTRPYMGRDEHRYPEIARNMLSGKSFLIPYWKGHPHLTKPPLFYWTIALSYRVFGDNRWGARVPNALAFAITAAALAAIGKRLFGEGVGLRTGSLYATTLTPFVAANIVTPDTLLVMWETLGAWAFFRVPHLAWVFWALAFMTKGTAVLPVMLPFLWYGWVKRRDWQGLFLGALVFLIIALPWYLYVQFHFPYFWKVFLKEQVTGRLFYNYFHRNSAWYAPFYLYLPLLTVGAVPIFLSLLKNGRSLGSFLKTSEKVRIVALWFLVPFTVFWLAKSRLPLYILPIFGPLSLLAAGLELQTGNRLPKKAFMLFWVGLLLAIKAGSSIYLKAHVIFQSP